MPSADPIQFLTPSEWLELEQDKIEARQRFLELSKQEAQSILDNHLDPTAWKPDFSQGFGLNSLSLIDDDAGD